MQTLRADNLFEQPGRPVGGQLRRLFSQRAVTRAADNKESFPTLERDERQVTCLIHFTSKLSLNCVSQARKLDELLQKNQVLVPENASVAQSVVPGLQ